MSEPTAPREQYLELERSSMDRWANRYDESFDRKYHKLVLRRLVAQLGRTFLGNETLLEEARVLDVGCGTGNMVEPLLAEGFRRIEGIDVSPRMVDVARRKYPALEWRTGSIEEVDMAAASYDLLTAFSSLHHLQDPMVFAAAARRALVPGGVLVFNEPDEEGMVATSTPGRRWLLFTTAPLYVFLRFKNSGLWQLNRQLNGTPGLLPEHHRPLPQEFIPHLEQEGFELCRWVPGHIATSLYGPLLRFDDPIDRAIGRTLSKLDVVLARWFQPDDFTAAYRRGGAT